MRLEPGMLIKTNYSGPYRIVSITRGCTCPLYLDEINMKDPPDQPPHIHLTCCDPDTPRKLYWLNWYDEETLLSLTQSYCGQKTELDYDVIIVLDNDKPVQRTLF